MSACHLKEHRFKQKETISYAGMSLISESSLEVDGLRTAALYPAGSVRSISSASVIVNGAVVTPWR
jgi:hypothetical protein